MILIKIRGFFVWLETESVNEQLSLSCQVWFCVLSDLASKKQQRRIYLLDVVILTMAMNHVGGKEDQSVRLPFHWRGRRNTPVLSGSPRNAQKGIENLPRNFITYSSNQWHSMSYLGYLLKICCYILLPKGVWIQQAIDQNMLTHFY